MTAPDIRGNVKFLLHRGRRPYMARSKRNILQSFQIGCAKSAHMGDNCMGQAENAPARCRQTARRH